MGGFADYSGSLTLELPLREAAFVAVQARAEPVVQVVSSGPSPGAPRCVRLPLAELREHSQSYAAAQAYLGRSPADAWVAYVAGVLVALQLELDPIFEHARPASFASCCFIQSCLMSRAEAGLRGGRGRCSSGSQH